MAAHRPRREPPHPNPTPGMGSPAFALRRLEETDEEAFFAAVRESAPELSPWLPWYGEDFSRDDARSHLRSHLQRLTAGWSRGERYTFAVVPWEAAGDEIWGICGLNHLNMVHRSPNLFYWVRSSRSRQGVITEAARRTTHFAFTELGLYRVKIILEPGNRASERVAQKLGARPEGQARNRILHPDGPRDALVYALIPSDLGLPSPPLDAFGRRPGAVGGD